MGKLLLKILITSHQFLPKHNSGTEILTFETGKGLQALGHEVKVVTGLHAQDIREGDQAHNYEIAGMEIFVLQPEPTQLRRGIVRNLQYQNDSLATEFGKILDSYRPDIVHFFHLHHLSFTFIDECVKRNIKIFLTPTAFWPICPYSKLLLPDQQICTGPSTDRMNCVRHYLYGRKNIFARLLRNLPTRWLKKAMDFFSRYPSWYQNLPFSISHIFINAVAATNYFGYVFTRMLMVDRVIVPNPFMADLLVNYGLDKKNVHVLPYGVNRAYHKSTGLPQSPRGEKLTLGFIGSLSSHKGLHILIDALMQLPDLPLAVKIYGEPSSSEYVDQIKRSIIHDKRISFLGSFRNEKIGEILDGLDAIVVPSIWLENSPLVIQSAQASNCPVIASDVKGINSFISHGDNGLLFPMGDSRELASHIVDLIDNPILLPRLRAKARTPLSIEDYCNSLDRQYREVV